MSEHVGFFQWLQSHLPEVLGALRKDKWYILAFTVAITILGFFLGNMVMKTARSTAHLIVIPMPSKAAAEDLQLAPKMDVTSVTLLCKADEVLERTLGKLNESNKLSSPIGNIRTLSNNLNFEITIAKETPMEKAYSDILELTAKASSPEDAAMIVNAWAEEIMAAVDRYEESIKEPVLEIFNKHFTAASEILKKGEEEKDKWEIENNLEFLHSRHDTVQGLVMKDIEKMVDLETQLYYEKARVQAYKETLEFAEPKLSLSWMVPDPRILDFLESKVGIVAHEPAKKTPEPKATETAPPKPETKPAEPAPEKAPGAAEMPKVPTIADVTSILDTGTTGMSVLDAIRKGQANLPQPTGVKVLTREELNTAYWNVYGQLFTSLPTVAGLEAQRQRTEQLLTDQQKEEQELAEKIITLETEKTRLMRRFKLAEKVYGVFHERRQWIELATEINFHTLKMLSHGAVWPKTYTWGIVGAAVLAMFGFGFSVFSSLFVRMFVQPAFQKKP